MRDANDDPRCLSDAELAILEWFVHDLYATARTGVSLAFPSRSLTPDGMRLVASVIERSRPYISATIVQDYYSGPPGSFTGD